MQFGPYLLRQRLGVGGMASVWKAIDESGRTLVIKRILPHLAEEPEFVEMFVREARLSARMRHPNIVRVFDHGDYEGERFLAMEYLHGRDLGSLMQRVAKGPPPPPGMGAFIAREVCRALVFVHALNDSESGAPLNLVHRDVSLSNVMLCFDGAVKLLDFGVAKVLADQLAHQTQAGILKGKWAYLAPEQVEGNKFDQRSDIFSVGIVLYEMLTGRRLFKAATDMETLERVKAAKVLAPSAFNPAVPPALDEICLKALARAPVDRYQTAAEMTSALDKLVAQLRSAEPELALMLAAQFPAEAGQSEPGLPLTAPRGVEGFFDDGDTELSAQGVPLAELAEAPTRPTRDRARLWRLVLAALLIAVLGGLSGYQLAHAQGALTSSSSRATPPRPTQQGLRLPPETLSLPPAAAAPAKQELVQGG
jgi:serine/threonine protein kinase